MRACGLTGAQAPTVKHFAGRWWHFSSSFMPLRGLIGATEAIGHAEKQMCQRVLEERKPSANQVPFFGMKFFFPPSQVSSDPHRFILLTVGGLLRFPTLHLAAWKKKVFELVKVICLFF